MYWASHLVQLLCSLTGIEAFICTSHWIVSVNTAPHHHVCPHPDGLTWRERQQNLMRTRSEAFSARHVWIIHSSCRDLVSHVTLRLRVRTPSRPICHSNCILLLRASIYCTWWKSNWMLLRGLNVWPSRRLMNLAELCFNVWGSGAGGVRYKNRN